MRVARWYNNRDIRIENDPTPTPSEDEIVVKVIACGICGSDLVEWYRLPRAPLVQGHEIGAEVVEVGGAVRDFSLGDRVFVAPKVPCNDCELCDEGVYPVCTKVTDRMPGGFAEFVRVPKAIVEHGTYPLPENVTFDQATFIEPLACAVRAARLAGVKPGQTMGVLGAGISGLLHVKLARQMGLRVLAVDVSETRLAYARKFGADRVVRAGDEVDGKVDCVMLCTGALPAVEQAWQMVKPGGSVVFFAVPGPDQTVTIPINDFWRKEIRVITSYYCGPPDIERSIELLSLSQVTVQDMVTHTLPLERIEDGFRNVMDGEDSLKVIIKPHG